VSISSDRDERFRAYAASEICIEHPDCGLLHVKPQPPGVTTGAFPADDGSMIYVITAHNPGRHLSGDDNAERHERLVAEVADAPGVTAWPAVGGDASWEHAEQSLALVGFDDNAARELGRRFEQEAIFAWDARALRVMACATDYVLTSGWSVGSAR
jgi:hypothetical protein